MSTEPTAPPEVPLHEGEEPPPAGIHQMAALRWLILLATAVIAALSFWFLLAPKEHGNIRYTCPMVEHAFIVLDEPGECPICHMVLTPMDAELIEARKASAHEETDGGASVPGVMPIALHLDRVQKLGVRMASVIESETDAALRVPAYVATPEQNQSQVHVRAAGFVEKIAVGQTGVSIAAGQALFYMYSPEIYRAQEELLAIRRFASTDGGALDQGPNIEASRRRLELLGLDRKDLDRILARDQPERATAVRAPAAGFVTRKDVALGAYVTPEMTLYELVDLSRVYVIADVFASDVPRLSPGSAGMVRFTQAGIEVEAKIELIYPEVDPQARTTKVRLSVSNKQHKLRPGMYGEATFQTAPRRSLSIPRDALIDTGSAQYVFIDEGEGHFAPRAVVVGPETVDRVEILEGLRAGERVVASATFLIDSESRLSASLAGVTTAASSAASAASSHVHGEAPPAVSAPHPHKPRQP